jgi:hypothetical protein
MNSPQRFRYVVLHHTGIPQPHYDFLAENKSRTALLAARLFAWPFRDGSPIEPMPPHRLLYLDYEGPVASAGGTVRRVAAGSCTVDENTPGFWIASLDDGQAIRFPRSSDE